MASLVYLLSIPDGNALDLEDFGLGALNSLHIPGNFALLPLPLQRSSPRQSRLLHGGSASLHFAPLTRDTRVVDFSL